MDKVAYFKITRLKISRFKSHVEETEYHFGDLTMISGGNHTGKTTIADAIAWVMIGQGFFGGHLLDRFYNDKERKKRIAVELEYVDASGIRHVLSRQRINDKVDAALDGSAIRQKDLNAMFGDADEFLSLVNPLYFVEILAEKGRGLLERNLPPVSQEEVLQRLNGDSQKALEGYSFLSPEAALSNLRAKQCALPGFVDSKNEEKTERNAGYLVVSQSGGGMLRQGTRKGIRRTPANRGMRAHRIVKSLDISEDVCHGLCP